MDHALTHTESILFTGTLAAKRGSFALQHIATMDSSGRKMTVIVVPGSGTAELTGISGTLTIDISDIDAEEGAVTDRSTTIKWIDKFGPPPLELLRKLGLGFS